jgi:hypothetical protein
LRKYSVRSAGREKSSQTAAVGSSLRNSVDLPVWRAPNTRCTYGAPNFVFYSGSTQRLYI